MDFERMNAIQRRLHNAACVLGADGDEYGFEQLQRDAIAEIERLRGALLLMRGRLLMENPHAVTTEADTLLLGPNDQS